MESCSTSAIYNKQNGLIRISDDGKVQFVPHSGSNILLNLDPRDIKQQLVNAPTSKKALMILTDDGGIKHKFQFTGRSEEEERKKRDEFKEKIAFMINQVRIDASSSTMVAKESLGKEPVKIDMEELKARQKILSSDLSTRKLHKDLVMTGYLTEEEFWDTRQDLFWRVREESRQEKGLSSKMINDIRPESSEGNSVKFVLTPDIIRSIFVHHPKLKQAFDEKVPSKMSEQEFWTRCLQSAFFYRDRSTNKIKDPIFDQAAIEEEEELNSRKRKKFKSLLSDLTDRDDLSEYRGVQESLTKPGQDKASVATIKRLNRHSELVLTSDSLQATQTEEDYVPRHKQILRSVLDIDDLLPQKQQEFVKLTIKKNVKPTEKNLNTKSKLATLSEISCFLQEEMAHLKSDDVTLYIDEFECQKAKELFDKQLQHTHSVLSPSSLLPIDSYQEVLSVHMNAVEILKHFWKNAPPLDSSNAVKARRLQKVLEQIKERMQKITQSGNNEDDEIVSQALARISQAINTAIRFNIKSN